MGQIKETRDVTPSEKNPIWAGQEAPLARLAAIDERTKNIDTRLANVEKKLDHFIEKHNDSCPGRFNIVGIVALLAGLIAILKSFVFTGKTP